MTLLARCLILLVTKELAAMNQQEANRRMEEEIQYFPWFVQNYFRKKSGDQYSSITLYEYAKEYRRFLNWLIQEGFSSAEKLSEITLEEFAALWPEDLEFYKAHLVKAPKILKESTKKRLEESEQALPLRQNVTVQRGVTALRSLFSYLNEAIDRKTGKPYLEHNMMGKVANVKDNKTMAERGAAIEKKLFLDDEALDFLDFVEHRYIETLESRQAITAFKKNQVRDLAIIGLFLGTGMRLAELVNMNVQDLDLTAGEARVYRKGGKWDMVVISSIAIEYLTDYLNQRQQLYQPDENESALFLTRYRGKAKRIAGGAVEAMVGKYSEAFKIKISPHKLRHSVATQLYSKTNSLVQVAEQLGQSGTSATTVYTHIAGKKKRDAMNDLWT
ncbi:tyrosine recombinase XerS [Enterococcus avium]|uniref:tyrosine recombinase XerS n=2 Tax=Enterococcus avium TaxID=33945 RepID=UPI001EFA10BC|nr:tyrosine recombinase XerS [Enterococcus avium]MDU3947244.1 tyrosine recombinase XerS [Enterococcus avium]